MPKYLFLNPILLLLALSAFPQDVPMPIAFEHLSVAEGLSSKEVKCMAQDQKGFMWFGTYDGLNRYNGYSFDVFRSNPQNEHSLRDNNIYSLLVDSKNTLWIGTKYGGLSRFQTESETFDTWIHNPHNPQSLSSNWVLSLFENKDGTLWIGTGDGLNKLVIKQKTKKQPYNEASFVRYDTPSGLPLKINRIANLFDDHYLWLSTSQGLIKFNTQSGVFERIYFNPHTIPAKINLM
ncbi:MAG: hypothetical protein HC880_04225 [Bacteroidia bacterium]|nr:hypothetical protein [Bacteroidia bacterium]